MVAEIWEAHYYNSFDKTVHTTTKAYIAYVA